MSIIYAILYDKEYNYIGEYPKNSKIRNMIIEKLIFRLPETNHKRTYLLDKRKIHYKYTENYIYFCITEGENTERICWKFIDEVENEILKIKETNKIEIIDILKTKMACFNDPDYVIIDKYINDLFRSSLDILKPNIDKLLDR